jgi:hypothetical protein
MSAWMAFREGFRRVNSAPVLLVVLALITAAVAVPATRSLKPPQTSQGRSGGGDPLTATAASRSWLSAQAASVEAMATPSTMWLVDVGRRAMRGGDPPPPTTRLTVVWLAAWALLGGGMLEALAGTRRVGPREWLSACRRHAWPLVRLAALAGACAVLLLRVAHGGPGALAVVVLAAAAALVFDYARVRTVVEHRRSAIGAIGAAVRFVVRRGRAVSGLLAMHIVVLMLVVAVYRTLSTNLQGADMHGWLVLALGQTYIVARHYLALVNYASAIALVQGIVTDAGRSVADVPLWPDSPSAGPRPGMEATSAR